MISNMYWTKVTHFDSIGEKYTLNVYTSNWISFESCNTIALLKLETFKKYSKFTLYIKHNYVRMCVVCEIFLNYWINRKTFRLLKFKRHFRRGYEMYKVYSSYKGWIQNCCMLHHGRIDLKWSKRHIFL